MRFKKKICWIVASPLAIKFFLMDQIFALSKKYDLTVITNTNDLHFLGKLVRVIPVKIERKISLNSDILAFFRLLIILNKEKFDLVHTLSPKSGLLGMLAAWLNSTPIRIHVFQGEVWASRKGFFRIFLKTLDRCIVYFATNLLAVSRSEAEFLLKEGIVTKKSIKVLANGSICGVDLNRFIQNKIVRSKVRRQYNIKEKDKIILYVGRLTQDKGILDLTRAFLRLALQNSNIHLLIVGPDEEDIKKKIEDLCVNMRNKIHFSGYSDNPEYYMAASDILCLPSYREGFGLVLIEAAAVGIPTVGSRIYGIIDAIQDGITGLLFRKGDIKDLTEKISIILKNEKLAKSLGNAGRQRVRRDFDCKLILNDLLKFYENLLKKNFS